MSSALKDIDSPERADRSIASFLAPTSGVHAVLFYGSEGSPIELTARRLAKGWLCTNLQGTDPCGECKACQAFEKGTLVDYHHVAPRGSSRIIRIHWIASRLIEDWPQEDRDKFDSSIEKFLRTPPLMAARKVVVIEDADRMNESAANALLKTLEEPHGYAKLILTTHTLSSLLPTVISRCQSIAVELPRERPELSQEQKQIRGIVGKINPGHRANALKLAEEFREICAEMGFDNARANVAGGLSELATALLASFPQQPERAQAAIEAHRRVLGNAQAGLVLDSLFAYLTS